MGVHLIRMNINGTLGYVVAIAEIVFGLVGLVTGWMSAAEATLVIGLGTSTFGIHSHNVAVGRMIQNRQS